MAQSQEHSLPEVDEGPNREDEAPKREDEAPKREDEAPEREEEVQNPVDNVEANPKADQDLLVTERGAKVEDEVKLEVESKTKIIHDPRDSATEPGDTLAFNSPGTPSNSSTGTHLPSFEGLAQSFPDKNPEVQSEIEVVEEQVGITLQKNVVSSEPKNSLTEASRSHSTPSYDALQTTDHPGEDSAHSSQGRNIHSPPILQNPAELHDHPPQVTMDPGPAGGQMRDDVQNPAGNMQANPQVDQAPAIAARWAMLVQVGKRVYAGIPNSIRFMLVMAFLVVLLVVVISPIIWPHSYT